MKTNSTVETVKQTPKPRTYPYWATNHAGDVFYVLAKSHGIAIDHWKDFMPIMEDSLTPLKPGDVVKIEVRE